MKQMFAHNRRRRQANRQIQLPAIALTPLIDTVLVLLIVFMVTSTGMRVTQQQNEAQNTEASHEILTSDQTLELKQLKNELEKIKEQKAEPIEHNSLFVRISSKGLLFINQERVTRKSFKTYLARALKKLKEPLKIVLLKCEPGVPLALVQEIKRVVHQSEGIHGVYEVK